MYTFNEKPERKIQIPIPGTDLHIDGVLRGDWSKPVVIFVHGIPSSNRAILQFLGAKYIADHGFATLRINLYDEKPSTRDLVDCTVQTHASDFDVVVEYVRSQSSPAIYGIGHSYGGLTLLSSSAKLDGAVLWDPSHYKCSVQSDENRKKGRHVMLDNPGAVVLLSGRGQVCPETIVQERITMQGTPEGELAQKDYPLLFITGSKSVLRTYVSKYYEAANDSKEIITIEGAGHVFDESDAVLFELLESTKDWLTRH